MERTPSVNRKSSSIMTKLSIKTDRGELINLREKYDRQCFNKIMTGFYLDLNNSQRNCQESILRSTNLVQTFFPKKPLSKSKQFSRHLSQRHIKSRSNGLSIVFSNKNKANAESIEDMNTQSQLKLSQSILKQQSFNKLNHLSLAMNKAKHCTQSSLYTKAPSQRTSSTNRMIDSDEAPELRRKTCRVAYDSNWSKREGFYEPKSISRQINCDSSYQKEIISSELLVLLDSISTFRLSYLEQLLSAAQNINPKYIAKLNIIIEETCVLIMEIAHLILWDFTCYLTAQSNQVIEYPSPLSDALVTDEHKELKANIDAFIEIAEFLKSANDMYVSISSQLPSVVLRRDKMELAKHYLSRCRYNLSKMIFNSKSYCHNSSFDEEQYAKYKYEVSKLDQSARSEEGKAGLLNRRPLKDTNERLRERLMPKTNKQADRVKQLGVLLNIYSKTKVNDNGYAKKAGIRKKEKHFDFDSKMFNQMLKYMSPERQREVLAEKLLNSYKSFKDKSASAKSQNIRYK